MIHRDCSLTASSSVWEQLPAERLVSGRPERKTTREEEEDFEKNLEDDMLFFVQLILRPGKFQMHKKKMGRFQTKR